MSGQDSSDPEFTAEFVREYLARRRDSMSFNDQAGICLIAKPPLAQEALQASESGLALNQNDADLWYKKGVALRILLQNDEAVTAFDRALRIHPGKLEALNGKGNALGQLGRFEEALACFDDGLKVDPGNQMLLANRALLLEKEGHPIEIPKAKPEPQFADAGALERSMEKNMRYWVLRRTARDQDEHGWYRRMEICAGPFGTIGEAEAEARRRSEEHQRFLHDENVDKEIRKKLALEYVNYWTMSDDTVEDGRRRGIDIH